MAFSIAFRCVHFLRFGIENDPLKITIHLLLPLTACIVFIVGIFIENNKVQYSGVVIGCIFFAAKALALDNIHMVLCTLLYIIVAASVYFTLFGLLKGKKLAAMLITAALGAHIILDSMELLKGAVQIAKYGEEISVIFIMLSLSFWLFNLNDRQALLSKRQVRSR